MFNKAIDLLYLAKQNKIEIILNEQQLQLKLPKNQPINKNLIQDIKDNKELIIDFLRKNSQNTKAQTKITRVDKKSISRIPLSFSQERLWFIDRLEGSVQYHMPAIFRLKGKLNEKALHYALKTIVERHEILRTVFMEEDGQGYQVTKDKDDWRLTRLSGPEYKNDTEAIRKIIESLVKHPFDLSNDYMLRAHLIILDENESVLVVTIHHIASDGWSLSVLVKEVVELYSSYDEDRPTKLPPLPAQYTDYAIWQRQYLTGEVLNSKIDYWKDKLEGVASLQLPIDYSRSAVQSTTGATVKFTIDKLLSGQLQNLGQPYGSTLFMTLLTAFKVLLFRYTGQQDICVGTPIAGRQQHELEGLIGFFVNTLVLRTEVNAESSYIELLHQVKTTTMDAYGNQEVPFEKVVDAVVKERSLSRTPLFQAMFILQNTPEVPVLNFGDVQLSREPFFLNISKFDITFNITETASGLQGSVLYSADLFTEQTIYRMIGHFKQLLLAIVNEPNQNIRALSMLTQTEERQLLVEFNSTTVNYPREKSMIGVFEEQAIKTPGAIAVMFEGRALTYKELNERSNQLGHYLRIRGVKEESLVPMCLERSAEMIVAILGILKAGGAYVPIDPDYPLDRIGYMLEDTRAEIVITSKGLLLGVPQSEKLVTIEMDTDWPVISLQEVTNLKNKIHPEHLAYVIYTSGSTGRPKGVMIEHRALLDHCFGVIESAGLKSCMSFALFSPLVFDAGHSMLFAAFILGASVHVLSREILTNGDRLFEYINDNEIDCIKIVPSLWMSYADGGNLMLSKKVMIFGGEAFSMNILDHLIQANYLGEVYNHYGPTEATIGKCIHKFDLNRQYSIVPIGRPFSNTQVYIVDPSGHLVPVGVAGELHIAGEGLAREYLNQPALTAAKFIADPFSKNPAAKMYKTGDLAKWLADGNIEYLGRMDEQVKIRGFRIELSEIETVLQQSGFVSQAVVLAKEDNRGNKRLVGYVVPDGEFNKPEIIAHLRTRLPEYMVPVLWVILDALPLTSNGKINKTALPEPETGGLVTNEYVAPRNELENKLSQIWQNLLGLEKMGIYDNFFEQGGHSLLAMRLVSGIRKNLETEVAIKSIFIHPTIASFAEHLSTQNKGLIAPSIQMLPRPMRIPLSFSQERLWFIDRLEGSTPFHIPAVLKLTGKLNREALLYALQAIVNRHEVLRTVFLEEDGFPQQFIKEKDTWELNITDKFYDANENNALQQYIKELIAAPFNLSKDHTLRANLLVLGEEEHVLIVTLHHIASDAWSKPILVREVVELYRAFVENRPVALPALAIQYADYAVWQRDYLTTELLTAKLNYWKEKLDGLEPLHLPTDFPRPSLQSAKGTATSFLFDKQLSDKLKGLSRQHETTLFMTMLAGFKVLLHRYTSQQDICIGTSIAGRQQQEVENLMGFFVNVLALRTQVDPGSSFTSLLKKVKQTTLDAYEHQEVPFEKVVDAVVKERDVSRSPLFQVLFVMLNIPAVPEIGLGELTLTAVGYEHTSSKYDITFFVTETAQGLAASVEYSTELFSEQTILRMMSHFNVLLHSIVKDPGKKIADFSLMTKDEEHLILHGFNNTHVEYPHDKTINQLFEQQAAKSPEAIALTFEDEQLTYRQLNERSNQFAHYLRNKGVKINTLVSICVERSVEMMVGILGILKAGGAYVPIDPSYPEDRIKFMLEDTEGAILITGKSFKSSIRVNNDVDIIDIFADGSAITKQPADNLLTLADPGSLAYVIYTSGSTGKPKGVLVTQNNVVSLVKGVNYVSLTDKDILLSTGSSSFDATTLEYWGMLLNGGQLVLCAENTLLDNKLLKEELTTRRINRMWVTSGWFNQLVEADITIFEPLETIMVGGEKLSRHHIEKLRQTYPLIELINGYGPTENTTFSLTYQITETEINKPIPIGRPLSNRVAFILDENLRLVPVGVPGEICLGGDGLTKGYLNRPELTAEKFVKSAFSKNRIYKTGDIGRWLPDGNIEYIGRKDDQVKIRGYRIEPGEIENVLLECANVKYAAVLARADKENTKRLVGYIVPNGEFDKPAIQSYLRSRLPDYMVPAILVEMESLPLSANGKIDRKALPDPEADDFSGNEYVAPRNQTEKILAKIWQDLLGLELTGIYDNFFEIGGDSLLAIRVVSAVRKELAIEMPIGKLFEYQTIASLAAQVEMLSGTTVLPAIQLLQRPLQIPLSFSQARLWFIDRLDGSLQYHIPAVMRLKGELNKNALEYALRCIVNRHEVLRTVFLEEGGDAYQFVKDKADWALPVRNGSHFVNDLPGLQRLIQQLIHTPFDLSKDNMLRADLVMLDAEEHILIVTLHHIASDGWSRSILVKEVVELYSAYEEGRESVLVPLPIQYADFAIWQQHYLQGEVLDKKLRYWRQKLEGAEPLQMPIDFPRPPIQTTKGAMAGFTFDKQLSIALQKLSQQQGVTLFMTLLAALKVLLYRYSSQKNICIGTGVAGRQQQEVEGLIGFFVNTLALRTELNTDDSFAALLQQVKKTTLEAYDNQEVPFEKVVDAVIKKRDRSKNPIFQVMFVLQNTPEVPNLQLGKLQLAREGYEHTTAQFDLSFSITEHAHGLDGSLAYNADLFKTKTIERLLAHFRQLVISIINEPEKKMSELSIMSKAEEIHVLYDLNAYETTFPKDKTIIRLFEEQVAENPLATAVSFEDEKLTYRQLNERANQLGHYLQAKGVKEETLVAISIERSLDMMVGILGILKAGGAYVPIDAEYPAERINFMLEDTATGIMLTNSKGRSRLLPGDRYEIINLDSDWAEIADQPTADLQTALHPGSLAYVIYTSGSTGKPKGVMVTQQNVVSLVKGIDYVHLTKEDVLLSTGSSSFDATTFEYWGMLLNGGQLVLCEEQTLQDSGLLKAEIDKRKVNKMWFTSSWLNHLVDTHIAVFEGLDTILAGGEKLSEHHIEKLRQTYPHIEIINGYGPTENTTFSLTYKITESTIGSAIPVGRPLNNRKAYVLDELLQPVPVGVAGEICLGGAGLSLGYLNHPALTDAKFVQHPFSGNSNDKIYKTGDIGRWLADGNIEYLGRIDEQVKIRGYRIELGEIEMALQETGQVSQAVVIASQDGEGNKRLVGYIVPSGSYNKTILGTYLRAKLPEYMIPSLWIEMEKFPLTSNGKIDKRALPGPDAKGFLDDQYVAPGNEMENKLVTIWQDILRAEKIGINDNFFELGGHSLLAMRLISAVRKQLQLELAVKELFVYPTVSELAGWLRKQEKGSSLPAIEVYPRPANIPLSFSQERLWFVDQLEGSVQYNSPTVLRLKGILNQDALTYALQSIISRHEVLRTVFYEIDGKPFQSIIDSAGWKLSYIDSLGYTEDRVGLQSFIETLIAAPFDLSKDYMLRADLIKIEVNNYVLVVTMHHIASDGWSLPVIVKEVGELYTAYVEGQPPVLPILSLQYADYAIWQRKYLEGEWMDKKTAYWKKKLDGVTALQLPTDYNRPPIRTVRGASVNFMIGKQLSDQLNQLSQQQGATLFMTLLATYKVMLHRYSGEQDICVGTSIANRPQQELEGLIGFFVNTLALRTEVIETETFTALLQRVKTTTLEAYEHQDVSFEKVVEEVVTERDPARTPLFQVMLVLLNTPPSAKLGFGELELSHESFEIKISKFEITFHVSQSAYGLPVSIVYNTDLFREDTIIRTAGHFQQLLISIVENPHQSIDSLQMLTEAEEQQLLLEFN